MVVSCKQLRVVRNREALICGEAWGGCDAKRASQRQKAPNKSELSVVEKAGLSKRIQG
ncbi:hypothetical protein GCM10007362_26030 [Saccharibacillus endophyticus]|uniref:Uncharacterized protein n=1 Tax=Saccharibacillus endophyticus TaxID=2060666 RepID=A0ABQ1ZWK0_9BACL|nr:hypothetical protein GCM10007362_26030 [Saccharibacillus endophyticus]